MFSNAFFSMFSFYMLTYFNWFECNCSNYFACEIRPLYSFHISFITPTSFQKFIKNWKKFSHWKFFPL